MQMALFVYDLLLLGWTYLTTWIVLWAYDANIVFMYPDRHGTMISYDKLFLNWK